MSLRAGSAAVDISPRHPVFLAGYPDVERISTGVHDPLLSSALALDDGRTRILVSANDILFIPKDLALRVRARLEALTGVPAAHILVSATHTHSGPLSVDRPYRQDSPSSPPPDPAYMSQLEEGIVAAAAAAWKNRRPAEAGLAEADGSAVGGNRRDTKGPSNPRVPVLAVREAGGGPWIALLTVFCMHPTVLHEDSTLVSADFPGAMRQHLQRQLGPACPVLHLSGPAGNQSPRHVARANTFAEAERLGGLLGQSVAAALETVAFRTDWTLGVKQALVDLPRRAFPDPAAAEAAARASFERWDTMRKEGQERGRVRTAECDWFGAARKARLARFVADGRLEEAAGPCMPAEIQVLRLGPFTFVAWPGELFVEFGLEVLKRFPRTHVIAYANGENDGYLVTAEAAAEGGYEAAGGLFRSPESGEALLARTLALLAEPA